MINSINLNRTTVITCAFLLNACSNQPIQATNQQSNSTSPAHYCFAEDKTKRSMYFTELFFGEIQLLAISIDFQQHMGQLLQDKSIPAKCKSVGDKNVPVEPSVAKKIWQLDMNKNRGAYKIKMVDWSPQTQSSDDQKTTDTHSIVLNNMLKVTVPDGFRVSSGPTEFDTKQGEVEQSLISIFDEPNQLVCQVAAKLFAKGETRAAALDKFRIKSKTAITESTKSLAGGAEQSSYRVVQSSGVEITIDDRVYFFEANESKYNAPIGYRIFCATETKLSASNRPKIDKFFSLIEWL